ncbi:MAG TPA: 30S ribosomal protein S4 [Methanothermobacter sp.]|nr:30S ribosomal protein S4p [Methanothermobacter sp. MT-2]HHW04363.1 30S ribosomal protein S4 [Methanothermobacter sp.]HOK72405.1 30S ribosomal protein S4 [Methanothermobacter sp.]HOL69192.1 30S ribosomal protein S4 [Methanothermobacter sp.]HPQ03892.1 30S ribosomal protein S4 [Methanothermobacter sp.]
MGHPRKPRKKYDTPPHPWNAERIKEENRLLSKYGLKNKKEIWKAETMIRRYRRDARHLLGLPAEQTIKEREQLLGHLKRMGILADDAKLEDVLNLTIEDVLKRRLQTMVYEKGLARTIRQARQMIIHGHITLDGSKVNAPGYFVKKGEEDKIGFYPSSPMIEQVESKAKDTE